MALDWDVPPDFREKPQEFYDYILGLHKLVDGLGPDVDGILGAENIPNEHANNKDTFLDQGGANEVTSVNAADAVTKKHAQGTDQGLDTGGLNASTAADVKVAADTHADAVSKHDLIDQAAAQVDVPAPTAVNPPAGGVGATAGAYDTAGNRDLMITSVTAAIADIAAMKVVVDGLLGKLRTSNTVAT